MSSLDEVYAQLRHRKTLQYMHIPHSVVVLACVAVRDKLGIEVEVPEMEKILYEEGLLPATEYGMPYWYVKKYMHNR